MIKRFISLFLCLILFVTTSVFTAHAENLDDGMMSPSPRYSYTDAAVSFLNINNGQAVCESRLSGYPNITTKINLSMTLEKKTLLWWSAQQTWTQTTNGYSTSISKSYNVGSGTYRVKTVCTVFSGSASETVTSYSQEVKV